MDASMPTSLHDTDRFHAFHDDVFEAPVSRLSLAVGASLRWPGR
jgi:hypothetical protein